MEFPQHCPSPVELDDLELLLAGAYGDRTNFDDTITLNLPDELAQAEAIELVDPEGFPLARWTPAKLVELNPPTFGPFRRLRLSPAAVRHAHPDALIVPTAAALTHDDLELIRLQAQQREVVLLALCGHNTAQDLSATGLVRATVAASRQLTEAGLAAHVVAVPLPNHDDAELDHQLSLEIAQAYGDDVLRVSGEGELSELVAAEVERDQLAQPGVVIFFTGLSGSGKSTIARALADLILEDGNRTLTVLDGDVVRRNLSAGLTFSAEDRRTNIRRIGWVAAEVARHGGVAICSPIAPFAQTRAEVREMTEAAGGIFVLIHVATPLAECERRDRKGLYAQARAGRIPDFTGISSPYEEPTDAALRVDTTGRSVEAVVEDVMSVLPFQIGHN